MIHYAITPSHPFSHLLDVCLTIQHPNPAGQTLSLPNWIPGSYLIRDFAKHLSLIQARTKSGHDLEIQPLDKSTWQVAPSDEAIEVHYQVYAWDLSVRGAHFDQTHAFFNGTSVFMAVDGQREVECHVSLKETEFTAAENWRVATTLPVIDTDANGFGSYRAENYRDLIEYPVEMGDFLQLEFRACGIPHRVALTGKFERNKLDKERLIKDLTDICETELKLFGTPYPFDEYLFQVMVTDNGYGGLEHTNSTALLCSRNDLPYFSTTHPSDSYRQFLELCSHEYFHSWNVKRIKPEVYRTADLSKPVYTNQLWWFEGITSYYDGLFLNRGGLVDSDEYLSRLAKEMTRVYRMPGRLKQSVAESSYLTWTKFYQQDENAPNAIVSYYTKGSLIALGLDLTIRAKTGNAKSLDDVLMALWQNYGLKNKGLLDGEIESLCTEISGVDLTDFFDRYLNSTEDLPFAQLFAPFGIDFSLRPATGLKDAGGPTETTDFPVQLGANLQNTEHQTVKLTHVWQDQAANRAGLAAFDEIIAFNGYKMASVDLLESFLKQCQIGDKICCHFFRRDELMTAEIEFQTLVSDRVLLEKNNDYQGALSWLNN